MTSHDRSIKERFTDQLLKFLRVNPHRISDGHHTFGEIYEHRFWLWIKLCQEHGGAWRSLKHADGGMFAGMFILGLGKEKGSQITYHLPLKYWDACAFAETLDFSPEWDGHSAGESLERLKRL